MDLSTLTAISAIDGRYRQQVHHLDEYFSEYALIRYRVIVEVEYLFALSQKKFFKLSPETVKQLNYIKDEFSPEMALRVKNIEKTTNHDVKAVEYFLKEELELAGG